MKRDTLGGCRKQWNDRDDFSISHIYLCFDLSV